jgi:EAL domain-containing protein (putative c-di-GMP-specific phosphodiesterase class I)
MEKANDTNAKMTALKWHGIAFSMDDFGTGYSSLSRLKHLPLDQLKIDQSFVRGVPGCVEDASIVSTIIALGRSLNLSVIAEGVETEGQRSFLENQGCFAYQGYLFSPALPASEFEEFVNDARRLNEAGVRVF